MKKGSARRGPCLADPTSGSWVVHPVRDAQENPTYEVSEYHLHCRAANPVLVLERINVIRETQAYWQEKMFIMTSRVPQIESNFPPIDPISGGQRQAFVNQAICLKCLACGKRS